PALTQETYGITPDMTTMEKILAGGLPGGAVGGRAEIIEHIAFSHDGGDRISHPGTYNANPLSSAAGSTCLEIIADGEHQRRASETAAELARRMNGTLREESVVGAVYGQASMLHIALGMETQPEDGYGWGWHARPGATGYGSMEAGV